MKVNGKYIAGAFQEEGCADNACCNGTETAWVGGPSRRIPLDTMRLKKEARVLRPKRIVPYSRVGNSNTKVVGEGVPFLRDGTSDGDFLRGGGYDSNVPGRMMPGGRSMGVHAEATEGLEDYTDWTPRYSIKYELAANPSMRLYGRALNKIPDQTTGYKLDWHKTNNRRRANTIIQDFDPRITHYNLARNPLAGPLPHLQYQSALPFSTGCDTIAVCPTAERFCAK